VALSKRGVGVNVAAAVGSSIPRVIVTAPTIATDDCFCKDRKFIASDLFYYQFRLRETLAFLVPRNTVQFSMFWTIGIETYIDHLGKSSNFISKIAGGIFLEQRFLPLE
jgi:hypothetical protein